MSSRERRRWVIARVVANARRERAALKRAGSQTAPEARGGSGGGRRKPPEEPSPK